jgi:glutaminyl-peptide cyclotransferase
MSKQGRRARGKRIARADSDALRRPRRGRVLLAMAVVAAVAAGLLFAAGRQSPTASTGTEQTARYGYRVVQVFPHDPKAFTQGLLFRDGFLYESTGLVGQSELRKVKLETGEVIEHRAVDAQHFAEGLADFGDRLFQLTWRSQIGFVYGLRDFKPQRTFTYSGEGWGLASDSKRLIMSDGTATLRFIDPESLRETGRLAVTEQGRPISNLNELEVVKGQILANVWQSDHIVIIEPSDGRVAGRIDLTGLLPFEDRPGVDVLNGIAWDSARDRLFVTGKWWPKLFEIKLEKKGSTGSER